MMGKIKIGIYCYLIADILIKVFQKCLLNGPQTYNFLSKHLVCLQKNIQKSIRQKLLGIKLKVCKIVHNIGPYKIIIGKMKIGLTAVSLQVF